MVCRRDIQENFIMQQATNENKLFVVSVPIDEKVCVFIIKKCYRMFRSLDKVNLLILNSIYFIHHT